jgi:hypothetical protein
MFGARPRVHGEAQRVGWQKAKSRVGGRGPSLASLPPSPLLTTLPMPFVVVVTGTGESFDAQISHAYARNVCIFRAKNIEPHDVRFRCAVQRTHGPV